MKRIAIISDTHGNGSYLKRAATKMKDCSLLIHLGDGVEQADYFATRLGIPTVCVRGNNDWSPDLPDFSVLVEEGVRIFCTHGHRYRVYSDLLNLSYAAMEKECAVALYGHTHCPNAEWSNGVFLLNPGSLGQTKGLYPISMAILTVDKGAFTYAHFKL